MCRQCTKKRNQDECEKQVNTGYEVNDLRDEMGDVVVEGIHTGHMATLAGH